MFEIDEIRYYYSARVSLQYFLDEGYVHTGECLGWKKTENLIGGGLE